MAGKPIKFKACNSVWKGWKTVDGWEDVSDLPSLQARRTDHQLLEFGLV